MSRLLSQAEVDALLASTEADESTGLDTSSETVFDLRAPIVLAGERLALVQSACETIAGHLAEGLTSLLATERPVRGFFTGLVQQPAATLLGTLAPGEVLGTIIDPAGEPIGGVCIQQELALAIVDRLQGGEGQARPGSGSLSPIETQLVAAALERLLRLLDHRTALRPLRLGRIEREPSASALVDRGGTLATAQLRMETPLGDTVCRLLMTPVLTNRLVAAPSTVRADVPPPELVDALGRARIPVAPVIEGTLRLTDLVRLRPGHVIQLDVREHESLGLRLGGLPLATGRVRRQGDERLFEIDAIEAAPQPAEPPAPERPPVAPRKPSRPVKGEARP
jgi:flagellar motor switch protein FliM